MILVLRIIKKNKEYRLSASIVIRFSNITTKTKCMNQICMKCGVNLNKNTKIKIKIEQNKNYNSLKINLKVIIYNNAKIAKDYSVKNNS